MIKLPADKVLHFASGSVAAALGVLVLPWLPWPALASLPPAWLAIGGATAAALLREAYNQAGGRPFDPLDVGATVAGGAPVVVALLAALGR